MLNVARPGYSHGRLRLVCEANPIAFLIEQAGGASSASEGRMSALHPFISITGSSGAGTTSVKRIFELIMRREKIEAAFIEGDAFHRYDRAAMRAKVADEEARGNPNFTHFNAEANELETLEAIFEEYGCAGTGRTRPTCTTPRRRRYTIQSYASDRPEGHRYA